MGNVVVSWYMILKFIMNGKLWVSINNSYILILVSCYSESFELIRK